MARSRLFSYLAYTTAFLTLGLIAFGGVVRVTDSGLGCGEHWPTCAGTLLPPLDNVTAWIEWLHRLFAALIGLFGLATLVVAIRAYRRHRADIVRMTAIAAFLFFIQSALGALVVVLELPPTFVTLHLGTAMLLLGALVVAALLSTYKPRPHTVRPRDSFTMLAFVTAGLSMVIILTGALVRGGGASLACTTWPLCNGELLPIEQGAPAMIHMLHRFSVAALGVAMGFTIWAAFASGRPREVRLLAIASFVIYLAQAGIGAMYVLSSAGPTWGALHVGFAAATWGLLVALCVVETMNTRELPAEPTWQARSELQTS